MSLKFPLVPQTVLCPAVSCTGRFAFPRQFQSHQGNATLRNILRKYIPKFQQADSEVDKKSIIDNVLQECKSKGLQFHQLNSASPLVDESIIKAKIGKVLSRKCLENFVLHENDVLCEIDKEAISHRGNVAYLADITVNRARYQAAADVEAKRAIAHEIIQRVKAKGGRFVRVDEFGGWYELSDEDARGKVQKALRMKGRNSQSGEKRKAPSTDESEKTVPLPKKRKAAKAKPASKKRPAKAVVRSSSQQPSCVYAGHDENRLFAMLFASQQHFFQDPNFSIELVEANQNIQRTMDIRTLDPRDILLQKKGSGLGYQLLLRIAEARREEFMKSSKIGKGRMAACITAAFRQVGSRFLIEDKEKKCWHEAEFSKATKKVMRALRDVSVGGDSAEEEDPVLVDVDEQHNDITTGTGRTCTAPGGAKNAREPVAFDSDEKAAAEMLLHLPTVGRRDVTTSRAQTHQHASAAPPKPRMSGNTQKVLLRDFGHVLPPIPSTKSTALAAAYPPPGHGKNRGSTGTMFLPRNYKTNVWLQPRYMNNAPIPDARRRFPLSFLLDETGEGIRTDLLQFLASQVAGAIRESREIPKNQIAAFLKEIGQGLLNINFEGNDGILNPRRAASSIKWWVNVHREVRLVATFAFQLPTEKRQKREDSAQGGAKQDEMRLSVRSSDVQGRSVVVGSNLMNSTQKSGGPTVEANEPMRPIAAMHPPIGSVMVRKRVPAAKPDEEATTHGGEDRKKAAHSAKADTVVESIKLRDADVICGIDETAQMHPGNIKYVEDVQSQLAKNHQATTLPEKNAVVNFIIKQVQGRGGRFVRYDESGGLLLVPYGGKRGYREKVRKALSHPKKKARINRSESHLSATSPHERACANTSSLLQARGTTLDMGNNNQISHRGTALTESAALDGSLYAIKAPMNTRIRPFPERAQVPHGRMITDESLRTEADGKSESDYSNDLATGIIEQEIDALLAEGDDANDIEGLSPSEDFLNTQSVKVTNDLLRRYEESTLTKLGGSDSVPTHQDSVGTSARIVSQEVPPIGQSKAPVSLKPLYVEGNVLRDNDVICSRDKGAQMHPGNKRYENLVRERVAEYHRHLPDDKSRDNEQMRKRRQDIKDGIIAEVRSAGGRFVRQSDDGRWYLVQEGLADGVNEKVRRALSSRKKYASVLQGQRKEKPAEETDFEDQSGGDTTVFEKDFGDLSKLLKDLQKDPSLADALNNQEPVKDIAEPGRLDVLLGRGGGVFNHHGNKLMRRLVVFHHQLYTGLDRSQKHQFVENMVNAIYLCGGRFLKSKDQASSVWIESPRKTAITKVSQAMRDHKIPSKAQEQSQGALLPASASVSFRTEGKCRVQEGNRIEVSSPSRLEELV